MKIRENMLIKFVRTAHGVSRNSVHTYSNKFSRHDFTQHQLLSLLCLKERMNKHYRDFIEELELMPRVVKILRLKKIPHFTTLQKFFKRISSFLLEKVLTQTVKLFDIDDAWIAIDGTGHSSSYASLYYAKKLKKQKKRRRKNYTKNQIAVDTESQAIVAHRVAKGPRHDSRDAIPLIRKSYRTVKTSGYIMDKAYDKEGIHKVVMEEAKAESMIPLRKRAKKGKYRLKMLEEFDEKKYHRRSLVETVFSVEKRVFGDVNYSRSNRLRNKESKLRNICYNIYRYVRFFTLEILKDFYIALYYALC